MSTSTYTPLAQGATPTLGSSGDAVSAYQTQLNTQNAGKAGYTPLVVDGKYGALTQAASTFQPAASSGGSPSLINTSSASKTNYNNNVSTLSNVNNSLSTSGNSNTSKLPAPGTQTAVYDATTGALRGYTQADGSFTDVSGKNATDPTKTDTSKTTGANSVANPDGSTTATNADGSSVITNPDGSTYNLPAGVDPRVGKMMNDNLIRANQDVKDASAAVDSAAALVSADNAGNYSAAAMAAAENIKSQFGVLIDQMKAKNAIALGQSATAIARYGGLGQMNASFLNNESSLAVERITALTDKMNKAIATSNAAYASGDVKALAAAQKTYDDAKAEAQNELVNLSTVINNAVKTNQAQAKIDAKAANDSIANDIKLSVANGVGLAKSITEAGYKDINDPLVQTWLKNQATALGISDITTLANEVTKAIQGNATLDLKNANTESIMKKRNTVAPKSTTYSTFTNKPTAPTITKVNAYLTSIGATTADIKKVNSDESSFYKVYNAIPVKSKNGS